MGDRNRALADSLWDWWQSCGCLLVKALWVVRKADVMYWRTGVLCKEELVKVATMELVFVVRDGWSR